jgi:hypothetical protein
MVRARLWITGELSAAIENISRDRFFPAPSSKDRHEIAALGGRIGGRRSPTVRQASLERTRVCHHRCGHRHQMTNTVGGAPAGAVPVARFCGAGWNKDLLRADGCRLSEAHNPPPCDSKKDGTAGAKSQAHAIRFVVEKAGERIWRLQAMFAVACPMTWLSKRILTWN